jgi:tripartite-type tricarboxylate transporter receptor subunit TctC
MRSLPAAAALMLLASATAAQDWPSRPIKMVVGFGAGGGTDIIARIVAPPLSEALGQPVVVENKPGAGGTIAADQVAKSPPDGHTVFMMNNGHAVSAVLYKTLPFDSAKDFRPSAMVATMPLVIVAAPSFEAADVAGLIRLAKEKPGKIDFASVGIGSTQHFAGELLQQLAGIRLMHIPYRGTPAAVAAVRSGEVPLLVEVASPVMGQIRAGEVKALALTSKKRFDALPQTRTVAEQALPDYDVTTWYALAFPAKTPDRIVARMNEAVRTALRQETIRKQVENASFIPAEAGTPEALAAHVEGEIAKWRGVMQKAGIEQQ